MSEVTYHDIDSVRDELKRIAWDIEATLKQRIDDERENRREALRDVRDAISELSERVRQLEETL